MRALVLALIFPWLALTVSPVAAQGAPAAQTQTPLPDVPLPAELDRVLRDYERAWNAGNAAGLAALFAEDGVILQSNQPPVRGRAAIEAAALPSRRPTQARGRAVHCACAHSPSRCLAPSAMSSADTASAVADAMRESSPLPCNARRMGGG